MKLGEFIENFSHNNIIRLVYKTKGGHLTVGENWDTSCMDWKINKAQGVFRHYIDNEVLGLVGIDTGGNYPETISIVIEELENQSIIEEVIEVRSNHETCES